MAVVACCVIPYWHKFLHLPSTFSGITVAMYCCTSWQIAIQLADSSLEAAEGATILRKMHESHIQWINDRELAAKADKYRHHKQSDQARLRAMKEPRVDPEGGFKGSGPPFFLQPFKPKK